MKQINKIIILGVIAILIIILIIVMTFFYVNNLRDEQLRKLKDEQKDEVSLIDQIENLTYFLGLYRNEDLIYGEGVIKNLSSTANGYYLLDFNNTQYHPKNLPNNYKKNNLTIKFIAYINESYDPFSAKQYINFLRIDNTDLELPTK